MVIGDLSLRFQIHELCALMQRMWNKFKQRVKFDSFMGEKKTHSYLFPSRVHTQRETAKGLGMDRVRHPQYGKNKIAVIIARRCCIVKRHAQRFMSSNGQPASLVSHCTWTSWQCIIMSLRSLPPSLQDTENRRDQSVPQVVKPCKTQVGID